MQALNKLYQAYNFSSTKCVVIRQDIFSTHFVKIEARLPADAKEITGIVIIPALDFSLSKNHYIAGLLSLSLNDGTALFYHQHISPVREKQDYSQPYPVNIAVKNCSSIRGYYADQINGNSPFFVGYSLSIYIHYT